MNNGTTFTIRYADSEDASVMEAFLVEIFEEVREHILSAYRDGVREILKVHPRTLINMIAANIVVNLVRGSLIANSTIAMRMEAIEETIDELNEIIRFIWHAFETTLASEDKMN